MDYGFNAALGPPELLALGQFWRPSGSIFPRMSREEVAFCTIIPWAGVSFSPRTKIVMLQPFDSQNSVICTIQSLSQKFIR